MRTSKLILVSGVALLLAFAGGYLYGQKKPAVTRETEEVRRNVVTEIKEVVRPDGSKEIVTVVVDRTKEVVKKSIEAAAPPPKTTVIVSATAQTDFLNLKPTYGILLQKPILGDKLMLGLGVNQTGQVQATAGWAF